MKRRMAIGVAALLAASLAAAPAMAQGRAGAGMRQGSVKREMMDYLYPIELVRRFAAELELSDSQIEKLREVNDSVRLEVERLKWDLSRETHELTELVRKGATKEKVYAQMDEVFKYENKLKKKHLGLLIVVRDILNKKQKALLDDIKEKHFERMEDMRGQWGGGGPPPHRGAPPRRQGPQGSPGPGF